MTLQAVEEGLVLPAEDVDGRLLEELGHDVVGRDGEAGDLVLHGEMGHLGEGRWTWEESGTEESWDLLPAEYCLMSQTRCL